MNSNDSIPPEDIQVLLKSLWQFVRDNTDKNVMFYTSDDGHSWTLTVFKDDDDLEGVTYDLGSVKPDF